MSVHEIQRPAVVNAEPARTATAEALQMAVSIAQARAAGLPGVVVMYGHSGVGKTQAIQFCINRLGVSGGVHYVECKSTWTRKAFLEAVMLSMGMLEPDPNGKRHCMAHNYTLSDMLHIIGKQLETSGIPLFVDDVQYLLDRDVANVLTDIHNASLGGTLVLVGEEKVRDSLVKLERLHNRVLKWVVAGAGSVDDLDAIARRRWPDVSFERDLLVDLNGQKQCNGCLRRGVVNLSNIAAEAHKHGWTEVNLERWTTHNAGKLVWDNGNAPKSQK
ncbi:MAG: AAA family ATPase [Aeromonas veronii]